MVLWAGFHGPGRLVDLWCMGVTISGALVNGFFYDAAIFVGGESPVNHPRSWKRKVGGKAKEVVRRR